MKLINYKTTKLYIKLFGKPLILPVRYRSAGGLIIPYIIVKDPDFYI